MFCSKCYSQVNVDEAFCTGCGTPLRTLVAASEGGTYPAMPTIQPQNVKKKSKKKTIGIILIIIGVFLLLVSANVLIDALEGDYGIYPLILSWVLVLLEAALIIVGFCLLFTAIAKSRKKPAYILKCPLCNRDISSEAKTCPSCGHRR